MFQGFEVDDDDLITTSEQVLVQGLDPQNIPWDRLQVSRQRYRVSHFLLVLIVWINAQLPYLNSPHVLFMSLKETRLEQYHNYVNLREVVDQNQDHLNKEKIKVAKVRQAMLHKRGTEESTSLQTLYPLTMLCLQDGTFYGFHQNLQSIRSDIAHFQVQLISKYAF